MAPETKIAERPAYPSEPRRAKALTPERRHQILAERAQALAATRIEARKAVRDVLAFRVGGERYAVPMDEIDEVLEIKGLSSLLGAPRHILGAIFARTRVLPVFDLRHLLGLEGGGMSDLTRVVVVGRSEEDLFGLAVEAVDGKVELPREGWSRPPTGPFLHVTGDRMAVLDLSGLGELAAKR